MPARRLLWSATIAVLLIGLPATAMIMVVVPDWLDKVAQPFMVLLTPGLMAALALTGNVHDDNRAVSIVVSLLFWTAVLYGIASLHAHLRKQRP